MEWGAIGFWIFLAALLVGGMWKEARQKAEEHETLRRIVEKTGTVDEARLRELFKTRADSGEEWAKPGTGYRALRVGGAIIICIGAAIAAALSTAALLGHPIPAWFVGAAIASGFVTFGLGMFFSSRFAEQPGPTRNEPPAR